MRYTRFERKAICFKYILLWLADKLLSFAVLLQPYGKRNKQFCGIDCAL